MTPFLPMPLLGRRDLETGLPDDTYAQVSFALQQVLGEQAEVFKETLDLTDQLVSNLVWGFYTAALGAAQFPQSSNMRASVLFEVRELQEALSLDTLFRNLVDQFAPHSVVMQTPLALITFQSHSLQTRA